jgi:hypothetical protein
LPLFFCPESGDHKHKYFFITHETFSTMTFVLDQSTYYDVESDPLNLSRPSEFFDFVLDDDVEDERGVLANSRGSSVMEELLLSRSTNAPGSDTMDYQDFDDLGNSLTDVLPFDAMMTLSGSQSLPARRRGKRSTQNGPASRSFNDGQKTKPLYALNRDIKFDPPVKRMSHGDISMCSYATAQSSHDCPPLSNTPLPAQLVEEGDEAQYSEALQKLAESMRRTEESRKLVLMQRRMLTPDQQHSLNVAKEQLRQQTQLVAQQFQPSQEQPQRCSFSSSQGGDSSTTRSLSPGRSSIMDAFFSGSRGTLTNGLDQSRTQLGNYMGQMNQRTFWG